MTESMEAHRNNNGSVRMKEKWHHKNNNEMRDQWDKRSKEASKDMGGEGNKQIKWCERVFID